MTLQTREERLLEQERKAALEFRDETVRERAKLVVADDTDVDARNALRDRVGQELTYALYRALTNERRLYNEYKSKLGWLVQCVNEQQRYLSEGRTYSTAPLQNVDDLNYAYGALSAAREAVASLCAALDVYCPLFDDADGRRRRAELLSYSVAPTDDGYVVYRGGQPAGEPFVSYDEAWKAWRAIRVMIHGH